MENLITNKVEVDGISYNIEDTATKEALRDEVLRAKEEEGKIENSLEELREDVNKNTNILDELRGSGDNSIQGMIDSSLSRIEFPDIEGNYDDTELKTRISLVEDGIERSGTVRFDRLLDGEVKVISGEATTVKEIVYLTSLNIFAATDGNGNYYSTWSGSENFMDKDVPRKDKVFICASEVYIWNVNKLWQVGHGTLERQLSESKDILIVSNPARVGGKNTAQTGFKGYQYNLAKAYSEGVRAIRFYGANYTTSSDILRGLIIDKNGNIESFIKTVKDKTGGWEELPVTGNSGYLWASYVTSADYGEVVTPDKVELYEVVGLVPTPKVYTVKTIGTVGPFNLSKGDVMINLDSSYMSAPVRIKTSDSEELYEEIKLNPGDEVVYKDERYLYTESGFQLGLGNMSSLVKKKKLTEIKYTHHRLQTTTGLLDIEDNTRFLTEHLMTNGLKFKMKSEFSCYLALYDETGKYYTPINTMYYFTDTSGEISLKCPCTVWARIVFVKNDQADLSTYKLEDIVEYIDGVYDNISESIENLKTGKADIDDYCPALTSGFSDNLVGRGESVEAEFTFRPTGGEQSIEDGVARIERIKGNTVVWNQWFDISKAVPSHTDTTITKDGNKITATIPVSDASYGGISLVIPQGNIVLGHYYLFTIDELEYSSEITTISLGNACKTKPNLLVNKSNIVLADVENKGWYINTFPNKESTISFSITGLKVIDLTLMFGAGNEPQTPEEFFELYPETPGDYNSGELLSFNGSGIKSTGFNLISLEGRKIKEDPKSYYHSTPRQFSEKDILFPYAYNGYAFPGNKYYENITFDKDSITATKKNNYDDVGIAGYGIGIPVKVLPNTKYYLSGKTKSPYVGLSIGYFDRDGVNVGYLSKTGVSGKTFTTPINCYWVLVTVLHINDSTPKAKETFTISNICLNLVHTGYRNGEYEEYKSYTRDLPIQEYFPDGGLKQAGKVYDEITETQAIKRIGVIEDLSTLNWGLNDGYAEGQGYEYYGFFAPRMAHQNDLPNIKLSVDTYTPIKHINRYDKDLVICIENHSEGYGVLIIRDNRSEKDVNSLKNLLKGVSLYYELLNPEITTFTEPLNLNYEVSDFGTEMVITSSFSTPLKADIVYGFNAVDTIRGNKIDIADIKTTTLPVMSEKIDNEITRSQDFDNRITDDVFGAVEVEDGNYSDSTGLKYDKINRCRSSISIPIRQLQGVKITKNPEGCYTWLQLLDKDKNLLGTVSNLWRYSPKDVNKITPVDFRNLAQPDTCFVNFVFKTISEGNITSGQKTICRDWLIDLLYQNKNIDTAIDNKINSSTADVQEKLTTSLENGDIIVGQSREVYSKTGKTNSSTFLCRTTAGSTSISDGIASIKQISGLALKNLVDGTFQEEKKYGHDVGNIQSIGNGVMKMYGTHDTATYISLTYNGILWTNSAHKYYLGANIYKEEGRLEDCIEISCDGGRDKTAYSTSNRWIWASDLRENTYKINNASIRIRFKAGSTALAYVKDWICIDLTELYGAGNEPTKEECDRLFSATKSLSTGLLISNVDSFSSIGYNQWNPKNIFKEKSITLGESVDQSAIVDNPNTSIAWLPCLPCKVGVGENNGYVIGYGEGNDWSDEGVEVYLSPIDPSTTTTNLLLEKLEKDPSTGTYVPLIHGYLLVVTPTTNKFCAHLYWSGDRAYTDYEEYIESSLTFPKPNQLESGELVGISSSGIEARDTLDFENNIYTKRIEYIDLSNFSQCETINNTWFAYINTDTQVVKYKHPRSTTTTWLYTSPNQFAASIEHGNWSEDGLVFTSNNGDIYNRYESGDANYTTLELTYNGLDILSHDSEWLAENIFCEGFTTIGSSSCFYGTSVPTIAKKYGSSNHIYISSSNTFTGKTTEEIKSILSGKRLYYELSTPLEYPILTKSAPNYVGSDYGVEKFIGTNIPLGTNILFYHRSLVSETRNFLDQLYSNTEKDSSNDVANYITSGIEENKLLATNAPNLALRMIFCAHGALYNDTSEVIKRIAPWGTESFVDGQLVITYDIEIDHLPGHYYLNGIGDITEEEMLKIYVAGEPRDGAYLYNVPIKTNICGYYHGGNGRSIPLIGLAVNNTKIKVINISRLDICYCDMWTSSFKSAVNLEHILPKGSIYINTSSTASQPFLGASNLKTVYLRWVNFSLDFSSSRYLSKGSVWTMIKYVKDNVTKNITITLHPDVYNALVNDPDIISVLEETNARISVSGGSISIATVSE